MLAAAPRSTIPAFAVVCAMAAALALAAPALAQTDTVVTINGARATLPPPAGMRSVDPTDYRARHPDLVIPAKSEVVALFIPSAASVKDDVDEYGMVQTNAPPVTLPRGSLATMRSNIERGIKSRTPDAIDKTNDEFARQKDRIRAHYRAPGLTLKATGMEIVELLHATPDLLAYTYYAHYQVAIDGKADAVRRPGMIVVSRINEAAVFVYYFGELGDSAAKPEFLRRMRQWIAALETANALATR